MIEMLLIFAFLMFIFGLGTGYMIFGRDTLNEEIRRRKNEQ